MKLFLLTLSIVAASIAAAAEYPPLDSPQNAMRVYFLSLKHGDKPAFRSSIQASPELLDGAARIVDLSIAIQAFQSEIAKIAPDVKSAQSIQNSAFGYDKLLKQVDDMQVKITGDHAVSEPKANEVAIHFIRSNNVWKLDLTRKSDVRDAKLQAAAMQEALPRLQSHFNLLLEMVREKRITAAEATGALPTKIVSIVRESTIRQIRLQQIADDAQ